MLKTCWNFNDSTFCWKRKKKPIENENTKSSKFSIRGEAPDQRMPPPHILSVRPWVDCQKTHRSWVLVHRLSYNQDDLSFSPILEEKQDFVAQPCGLVSTLTSILGTKAWKSWEKCLIYVLADWSWFFSPKQANLQRTPKNPGKGDQIQGKDKKFI